MPQKPARSKTKVACNRRQKFAILKLSRLTELNRWVSPHLAVGSLLLSLTRRLHPSQCHILSVYATNLSCSCSFAHVALLVVGCHNRFAESLVIEPGGHENVSFIERDCRNHIQKERRLWLGDGDDAALQNYFMKVQAEDNSVRKDVPKAIQYGGNEPTVVTGQGSCSYSGGNSINDNETVRDPVVMRRKGRPPCQRKKSNKFSKSKKKLAHSNAKDGQVNDQIAIVIPTPQNLDKNMYPHGIMDYCNDFLNLHHIIGDNVNPTSTQNSCTEPQFQSHGHFQQP
ncbi:hypothetical protein WN943_007062 [Citrus x changshan-huyou]